MKTIAIYNRKGGVGKTVSCVNIAGCLERKYEKKVLIVDIDAQASVTSYLMLNDIERVKYSILNIFEDPDIDPDKVIYKAKVMDRKDEHLLDTNIYVVPAVQLLDNISISNMYVIRDFLKKVSERFDFCLIDCFPSVTEMTINALCAADFLMIPVIAGRDSVMGYGTVMQEINMMKKNCYNVNLRFLGVFLNRVNKRKALEEYYRRLWKNKGNGKIFSNFIRDTSDVVNAQEFGKPIHYYKKCDVMGDYEKLTEEILSKIKIYDRK